MTKPLQEEQAVESDERVRRMLEIVREMSTQTDPHKMVTAFGEKFRWFLPTNARLSLSRRDLRHPQYRITRFSEWDKTINPWQEKSKLPLLSGGMLAELIYGDQPVIIDDLQIDDDEPAAEYLRGYRSLQAIPHFDRNESINMAIALSCEPNAFSHDQLADALLINNLFGRATNNLVLSAQLRKVNEELDMELKTVGQIQQSMLPCELPAIPGLDVAAYYQTARRAGGDYYDLFPLPNDCWGIFIADVSGHGTPAAVLMAVTHAMAHSYPGPPMPPCELLTHLNSKLFDRCNMEPVMFVTAFYAVVDPQSKTLTYASAGHNPPRWCRDGKITPLDSVGGVPLGVVEGEIYDDAAVDLKAKDQVLFYTDGITETFNPDGDTFGEKRLDQIIASHSGSATELIDMILDGLSAYAIDHPILDDRTLLSVRVTE